MWGYLDWVTGLVRINVSGDEFSGSRRTTEFELTLNHELFHAFQICTTGYLYRLSMETLREIVRIISSVQRSSDILRLIRTPPAGSATLDTLLSEIDESNNDGITVRDIVEGYAYFAHEALNDPSMSATDYSAKLVLAPSAEYTNAFRFSVDRIGERSFEVFPLLCYLALLFRDPTAVFGKLHDRVATLALESKPKLFRQIVHLLDHVEGEYLGVPCQHTAPYNLDQPFYGWSMRKIRDTIGPTLLDYVAEPGAIPLAVQEALLRPIILNDFHKIEPHSFRTDSQYSVNAILVTAVVSFRILAAHPAGPRMLSFPTC